MARSLLQSALQLPPAERILLVEQVWDSLVEADADVPLSQTQLVELKQRELRLEKNGSSGEDWTAVKQRLLKRRSKR